MGVTKRRTNALRPGRRRATALVSISRAVLGILVAGALLLSVSGCIEQQSPMTASDLAALKTQVAHDYPGWTIEKVYQSFHGGLDYRGAEVVLLLERQGPQDFWIKLGFDYNGSPNWTQTSEDVFKNPRDAAAFIDAFRAVHPEPGWVVDAPLVPLTTQQGGLSPSERAVMYSTRAFLDASEGGLGDFQAPSKGDLASFQPHTDLWRGTVTNGATVWKYISTK